MFELVILGCLSFAIGKIIGSNINSSQKKNLPARRNENSKFLYSGSKEDDLSDPVQSILSKRYPNLYKSSPPQINVTIFNKTEYVIQKNYFINNYGNLNIDKSVSNNNINIINYGTINFHKY